MVHPQDTAAGSFHSTHVRDSFAPRAAWASEFHRVHWAGWRRDTGSASWEAPGVASLPKVTHIPNSPAATGTVGVGVAAATPVGWHRWEPGSPLHRSLTCGYGRFRPYPAGWDGTVGSPLLAAAAGDPGAPGAQSHRATRPAVPRRWDRRAGAARRRQPAARRVPSPPGAWPGTRSRARRPCCPGRPGDGACARSWQT